MRTNVLVSLVVACLTLAACGDRRGRLGPVYGQPSPGVDLVWQNEGNRYDVNGDGIVSLADVLSVVTEIRNNGTRKLPRTAANNIVKEFVDVDGDGFCSIGDIYHVVVILREVMANPDFAMDTIMEPTVIEKLYADLAAVFDREFGLYTEGQYFEDFAGMDERWMRGKDERSFYILPSGALYEATGTSASNAKLIATLPTEYYDDPSLLHEASEE